MAEPKTATSAAMLDYEERRLELRDRRLAMACAHRSFEENWDRSKIDDERDAERAAMRSAEMAAYYAIMAEREAHAEDMRLLKLWSDAKWAEEMAKPVRAIVNLSDISK